MSTLHERLAALADEAPSALPETGLWERGRRYGRVRRAGTVAIALVAVLVLVGIAGVTWQQGRVPDPAPAGPAPALPDRIWSPSPWLDGTEEGGPLGQLAALLPATRGGVLGSHRGLVGISAVTGEYRFLDLPDLAGVSGAKLSPDGRFVAYWLTGAPSGPPPDPASHGAPVIGPAVYDTTTGQVIRAPMETEHGLTAEELVWVDDTRLVVGAGQIMGGEGDPVMDQMSSRSDGLMLWDLGRGTRTLLPSDIRPLSVVGAGAGRLVVSDGRPSTYRLVDLDQPSESRAFALVADVTSDVVPDVSGTRIASVAGATGRAGMSRNPNKILAGALVPRTGGQIDRADVREVPASRRTFNVLRWLDDDRLAVVRAVGQCCINREVYSVDVASGQSQRLVRLPMEGDAQLAMDLLADPTVAGVEPPTPLDPRLTLSLTVLTLGAGGLGLRWWRRRVRA